MYPIRRFLLASAVMTIGVLPTVSTQARPARPLAFRLMGGIAVPTTPGQFRANWNLGPNAAASVAYSLSSRVDVALAVEYGSFGANGSAPSPPAIVTSSHPTPLWAGWLQTALSMPNEGLRPRALVGIGVVAHGAARSALGLQAGVGIERSLGDRIAGYLETAFAYAFTADPSRQAGITEDLSYAPIRVGLVWR